MGKAEGVERGSKINVGSCRGTDLTAGDVENF